MTPSEFYRHKHYGIAPRVRREPNGYNLEYGRSLILRGENYALCTWKKSELMKTGRYKIEGFAIKPNY